MKKAVAALEARVDTLEQSGQYEIRVGVALADRAQHVAGDHPHRIRRTPGRPSPRTGLRRTTAAPR